MRSLRWAMAAVAALALLTWPGTAVVAQDDETVQPPVELSGRLGCTDEVELGRLRPIFVGQFDEGSLVRRETRGGLMRTTVVEMSDPRLVGTWTTYGNTDEYIKVLMASAPYPALGTVTVRMENEGGAWQGSGMESYVPGIPLPEWGRVVLVGEGAYDGLIAVLANRFVDEPCGWEVRGYIVSAEIPPIPEPTSQ